MELVIITTCDYVA